MSRRTERVASLIRNTIGQLLLSKLSDPRIATARTSVTRVVVPEDLLSAKVYVSVLGSPAEQRNVMRALTHAAGHIRELLMREISLRHSPELNFVLDTSFQNTLQTYRIIDQAMEEIRRKEQAGQPSRADDADGEPQGAE